VVVDRIASPGKKRHEGERLTSWTTILRAVAKFLSNLFTKESL
jgi:hypothetical protein